MVLDYSKDEKTFIISSVLESFVDEPSTLSMPLEFSQIKSNVKGSDKLGKYCVPGIINISEGLCILL